MILVYLDVNVMFLFSSIFIMFYSVPINLIVIVVSNV